MFRSDFKEFVDLQLSERRVVAILGSSLSGKPLDLVEELSNDYQAACKYLDTMHGDPKVIADAVDQGLIKFKVLR